MRKDLAEAILSARGARRPVALLTWLANGEQQLVSPDEAAELPDLGDIIADAFRLDKSGTVEPRAARCSSASSTRRSG